MLRYGVDAGVIRLVGTTEAQVIQCDGAEATFRYCLNKSSVQIAPRRIPVHHHNRRSAPRPFVNIVHSTLRGIEPAWLVRPCSVEGPIGIVPAHPVLRAVAIPANPRTATTLQI